MFLQVRAHLWGRSVSSQVGMWNGVPWVNGGTRMGGARSQWARTAPRIGPHRALHVAGLAKHEGSDTLSPVTMTW